VANAIEIRVFDLFAELTADALVVLALLQPAGTIAAGAFQTLLYTCHNLRILVITNLHTKPPDEKTFKG